jgi:hypothetical protein
VQIAALAVSIAETARNLPLVPSTPSEKGLIMPSVFAGQSAHVTCLAVSAQYNPKELGVEQASASESCSVVRSISGFGTYDPVEHLSPAAPSFMDYTDDCAAVYQHNQSDLESVVTKAHGHIVRVASAGPEQVSFELMFDGVKSGPCHMPSGRDAGTDSAIKGSLVNINLVSPTSRMDVRWEGPEFDACVRRRY